MKIITTFLLIMLACTTIHAQQNYVSVDKSITGHPRLLLLKGEETGIRRTTEADAIYNQVHQAILAQCDTFLRVAPLERIKIGKRLLSVSREGLRRVFYLSYAWRMTKQEKYAQRAEKELLAVSAFSDWNPSHFLDVGEMTMAASIGYDWLYDQLSEASRLVIKDAILKKGLEPSMDTKSNGWLKVTNNWNQVCNAGITYGAIATYEDHPELSVTLINRAINAVQLPMKEYGPDGGYQEGYGYWEYGTTMNVMLIHALDKLYGKDFGLSSAPGFLKTARFLENMTGPTMTAFNFSDGNAKGVMHPAMFWFASKSKDPSLLWVERQLLTSDTTRKDHVRDRFLPALLLWSSGLPVNSIAAPKETVWVGRGSNPVAMMRSSWTDTNAIYVAMKGGSPSVSHAHMDVGSFIMDADGVRWAMDFGSQSYESLESKGVDLWNMKQNSPRWQVFRYNNLAHNTLTINNALQKVEGFAPIISHSNSPDFMNTITDVTDVYKNDVAKAIRGIGIINRQYVLVRDEIQTLPKETTIRWTMATPALAEIKSGNTIELTQNGKRLLLKVQEPAEVTMKTWPATPVHDYDAPNPGIILVGFETKLPPGSKAALTVMLIPEKSAGATMKKVPALEQWPKGQ